MTKGKNDGDGRANPVSLVRFPLPRFLSSSCYAPHWEQRQRRCLAQTMGPRILWDGSRGLGERIGRNLQHGHFFPLPLLVSFLSLHRSNGSLLLTMLALIFLSPGWSGQPARGSLRGGGLGGGDYGAFDLRWRVLLAGITLEGKGESGGCLMLKRAGRPVIRAATRGRQSGSTSSVNRFNLEIRFILLLSVTVYNKLEGMKYRLHQAEMKLK